MLIKQFNEEQLKKTAQLTFPRYYIHLDQSDIYLKGKQAGRYKAAWLDHEFYVSTEYAYEDILVNNNKTRYKVHMPCILLKTNPYEVIYDSQDRYYGVYEEDGEIKFEKYVELIKKLPEQVELLEELTPV